MEKRNKVIFTFAFAILLVSFLYVFSDWFSKTTGYLISDDPEGDLAKCLSEQGSKLYGSKTCPDCKRQKDVFGDKAFESINYVECSKEPFLCSEIDSVPAWDINGTIYYGMKSIDELRSISECY